MTEKPFSQSCENNKNVILEVLNNKLKVVENVLEIGYGTGQHAVYFSTNLPHLVWQTSDREQNHAAIIAWLEEVDNNNLLAPLILDVEVDSHWPKHNYQAVYSANTAHIMSWGAVKKMFQGVASLLQKDGLFIQYGPFNKDRKFSSESNQNFEYWLKQQGAEMGIRDITEMKQVAKGLDLELQQEIEMPANNLILLWKKNRSN